MRLSDAQRMYDADNNAIHVAGIPSLYLMENAAGHLARAAMEIMGENPSAVIFCGAGNNGGDGIAAGAILLGQGVSVRVFLVGKREKLTPDSRAMLSRLETAGGALEDFDPADETMLPLLKQAGVIVDAMFGIGLKRPLTGTALAAVEAINASGTPVVAADIPSGVSADTGAVLGAAVQCVRTVTFSMAKPGHFLEPGCLYAGKVEPCPIGIPEEMLRQAAKMAVCKINIDSDLRLCMTGAIRKHLNDHPDHFDPRQYLKDGRDELRAMVQHKIRNVLGSSNTL